MKNNKGLVVSAILAFIALIIVVMNNWSEAAKIISLLLKSATDVRVITTIGVVAMIMVVEGFTFEDDITFEDDSEGYFTFDDSDE